MKLTIIALGSNGDTKFRLQNFLFSVLPSRMTVPNYTKKVFLKLFHMILLDLNGTYYVTIILISVSKCNRKRSPFMSAKLSLGDIMATEMHATDDTIMNIS